MNHKLGFYLAVFIFTFLGTGGWIVVLMLVEVVIIFLIWIIRPEWMDKINNFLNK